MENKPIRKVELSDERLNKLRRFNLIMGAFHLIQGILMIVLSNDSKYTIFTNYLTLDTAQFKLLPAAEPLVDLPFGIGVAIFLLISAVAHFLLGTVLFKWYGKALRSHKNPARFYEYALSSSWMIVLIGMLTGVRDYAALIALFGVNASMNLFGIVMEQLNQYTKKVEWSPFIFGSFAGIIPWIAITAYFVGSISSAPDGQGPPDFVYAIIPTLFVFFNSFAINMILQYKKVGKWKDYIYGERVYIILSLLAKTALAWQIFAGTLNPVA
jgi:hypothetical protein